MTDFTMNKEKLTQLTQPLDVKKRKGSGNQFYEYVSIDDVIDRLNAVFEGNWSSETAVVSSSEKEVILSAKITAGGVSHCGYGGSLLSGEVGAAYKSAKSKAIKDAAKSFGVGVHDEEDTAVGTAANQTPAPPREQYRPTPPAQKKPAPPVSGTKPFIKAEDIPGFTNTSAEVPEKMAGRVVGMPVDMEVAPSKSIPGFTPPSPAEAPKAKDTTPPQAKSLINEVQKSAIDNALRTRVVTYDELWEEAVLQLGLDPAATAKELDSLDRVVASRMVANSHTKSYK